jgi:hypothetical protein
MNMAGRQNSLNPATDNPPLLIIRYLRKAVTRPEVPPSITSSQCTDFMTLFWVIRTQSVHSAIIMASKDPKMSQQGTAGKRKHVILTMPQKLEPSRRLESGKSQREIMA